MSNNNVISEKKKFLLAYKEKLLNDIKYAEKTIENIRANNNEKVLYHHHADSSDSDDDFTPAINIPGPSIEQLKQEHASLKTCLQATEELTGLIILESDVNVLVEDPKFEGERPVTEPGTWREVTVECRVDIVFFSMTFFMFTPDRKFAPRSYRCLRVVPLKRKHEQELANSVLHSAKVPSDAVEVLRSYARAFRSRRTTLAYLTDEHPTALFMEYDDKVGYVLRCADLLEVSWRLENKWSPVASFLHKMKFNLEYMEKCYVDVITKAHKQLLNPSINTDERSLLLEKIVTTCLEARGIMDPESDLQSKTTERDNDIDKRDSESEKRDSEVMAPPKSLPKKVKQKTKESLANTGQKRNMDRENSDSGAKKMKNDAPETKKSIADANNTRKTKINDVANEGGKKRKIGDDNKVDSGKNVKGPGNIEDGNAKPKNVKETVDKAGNTKPKNTKGSQDNAIKEVTDKNANTNPKPKNMKESASTDKKNIEAKTKNKATKEAGDDAAKNTNAKPKTKENANTNPKPKNVKESVSTDKKTIDAKTKNKATKEAGDDAAKNTNAKPKTKENANTNSKPKNVKESATTDKKNIDGKTKNKVTTEAGDDAAKNTNAKPKTKVLKKPANLDNNAKSKNIITKEINKDQEKEKPAVINSKEIQNKDSTANSKVVKDPAITGKVKTNVNKAKVISTKQTNNPEGLNQNENNPNTKNIEKNKLKNIANTKSKENIDANKDAGRPKTKNIATNINKIVNKPKNTDANKVKNVVNTKTNDQTTKKAPEKNINGPIAKNEDKAKKVIKKPTAHKIASHTNSLKTQNLPKLLKTGNTKTITTGNTEKENGGKASKIPQKTLTTISEGSSKTSLRISPREIPSKIKATSQETVKQKTVESTNIPRLLKKPAPKTT